jgi:hypothetical protein
MAELAIAPARAALDCLVAVAQSDTGQARRVANFLLAWWNAGACGGFDLTDLWMLDRAIADNILAVARLISVRHEYPTAYGLGPNSSNWPRPGGPTSSPRPRQTMPENLGRRPPPCPARARDAQR